MGDIDAVESKLAIWQQLRQTVLRNNQTVQEIDLRFELPYIR